MGMVQKARNCLWRPLQPKQTLGKVSLLRPFSMAQCEPLEQKAVLLRPSGFIAYMAGLFPSPNAHPWCFIQGLLPRPWQSVVPKGQRLWEFVNEWLSVTWDPFVLGMVQGYLLQCSLKPQLMKPSCKYKVKIPKAKKGIMSSEIDTMLPERTELGPQNEGFFTYPFVILKEEWNKLLHNESEATQTVYYLHTIQDDHAKAAQGGHLSGSLGSLARNQVSKLPHTLAGRHCCFLHLKWNNFIIQFRALPFGLSTVPKTFTRVMRTISLQWWRMWINLFLYTNNAFILGNSLEQTRIDWQRLASLLHRFGFELSHCKCLFKPLQVFLHIGLMFNTREMTISLPGLKLQTTQTEASLVTYM